MRTILTILTVFICSYGFSQGLVDGYFKGKGKVDIAVSSFFQTTRNYFVGFNEVSLTNPTFYGNGVRTFNSFGLFAEYGITAKWDVIINAPLINKVFQDGSVATKYELAKKKVAGRDLSIISALQVSFPLSDYETENFNAVGQQATIITPKIVVQHTHYPKDYLFRLKRGTTMR